MADVCDGNAATANESDSNCAYEPWQMHFTDDDDDGMVLPLLSAFCLLLMSISDGRLVYLGPAVGISRNLRKQMPYQESILVGHMRHWRGQRPMVQRRQWCLREWALL